MRLCWVGLVVAVGLLTAPDSAGQSPPRGARNDEDAIKAVIAATTDALSRHSPRSAEFFAPVWANCRRVLAVLWDSGHRNRPAVRVR